MNPSKINSRLLAATGVAAFSMLASCAHAQQPAPAATADRPNVVFILADDLGWMDTKTYGSKFYDTPNVDALRARGMMFTRAYTANPLCSPTRASILTGQYPGRMHLTAPHCGPPPTGRRLRWAEPMLVSKSSQAMTRASMASCAPPTASCLQRLQHSGNRAARNGVQNRRSQDGDSVTLIVP